MTDGFGPFIGSRLCGQLGLRLTYLGFLSLGLQHRVEGIVQGVLKLQAQFCILSIVSTIVLLCTLYNSRN